MNPFQKRQGHCQRCGELQPDTVTISGTTLCKPCIPKRIAETDTTRTRRSWNRGKADIESYHETV